MDLRSAINAALEGHAVLFAGSGFSYGAVNIHDESLCCADALRDKIGKECGVPKPTQSLDIISQYYIKKKSKDELIDLIKDYFTVKQVAKWHEIIASMPWKRIYTTNYDSVIEVAARKMLLEINSIVLSDRREDYDLEKICVHLNGSINRLNRSTLDKEFKLIDTSYSCEKLDGNEWFELFKDDLYTAKAIIIIGYSMQYDIDIKRLLSAPDIKKKVIFIDRPEPDPISASLLEEYGTCEFVGIDNFANELETEKKIYIPPIISKQYRSFCWEYRSSTPPRELSFSEINDFYIKGTISEGLLSCNHGEYRYVILRDKIDYVLRKLKSYKVFLVLSDLGNGKSMFCRLLRDALRQENLNVFTFLEKHTDIAEEVKWICNDKSKHTVVIFDDYKRSLNVLNMFKFQNTSNITFVVTSRKAMNSSNLPLIRMLGVESNDIHPICLDQLSTQEVQRLSFIISNNSLYNAAMKDRSIKRIAEYIESECHGRFADLLLKAFESSDIKQRLVNVWENNPPEDIDIQQVVILGLMKALMGINFDFTQMLDLLKCDYVLSSCSQNELLNEFFNLQVGDITIKSAVVAREVIKNVVGISRFVETAKAVIKAADKDYTAYGLYDDLLKNMVSHSHFRIFNSMEKDKEIILSFYNDIRNTNFCRNNIFYWEQFATACIESKDFDAAKRCIDNAFVLAKERGSNFEPFHISNIYAKYLIAELLDRSNKPCPPSASEAIDTLVECHEALLKYYSNPENNPVYTFRVAHKYVDIYDIWGKDFNVREQSVFMEKKAEIVRLMKGKNTDILLFNCPVSQWIEDLDACKFIPIKK